VATLPTPTNIFPVVSVAVNLLLDVAKSLLDKYPALEARIKIVNLKANLNIKTVL
jgi:hypothetical protein